MKHRNRLIAALATLSLLTPLAGAFRASAKSPAQGASAPRRALRKMTDDLLARSGSARQGTGETARVIVRAAEGQTGASRRSSTRSEW